MILVLAIIGVMFGAAMSFVIRRRLIIPLQRMADATTPIAQGDLRSPSLSESTDEIGRLAALFNRMVQSLQAVLAESKTMTEEVATAAQEIAAGAQQQLSSLSESSTAITEITTAAEQFKATMREFADRARAVQEAAEETGKRTDDGLEQTRQSNARIQKMRENAVATGGSVLELSEQMERINEITATVHEIAEQTKLLSLNASIEAARAGEEGRGFAVVATQVRELANQSKEAAGRIESIISHTQKSMQTVVSKIEEGSLLSEQSSQSVNATTEAFEEIATAVRHTIEAMKQIATGAKDQERGVVELAEGISQISTGAGDALAAAHQTRQSIMEIDHRLRTLNDRMSEFKT
jgi:methyl-accepting chemotaxis protein